MKILLIRDEFDKKKIIKAYDNSKIQDVLEFLPNYETVEDVEKAFYKLQHTNRLIVSSTPEFVDMVRVDTIFDIKRYFLEYYDEEIRPIDVSQLYNVNFKEYKLSNLIGF